MGDFDIPADIEQIDAAVRLAPVTKRQVLIQYYAHRGPVYKKAHKLGISPRTFNRILEMAESFVAQRV